MKYTISTLFIGLSLLLTLPSQAEYSQDSSFEVFTNNGQRVQYDAETQILNIFDINGDLKVSGETIPVTSMSDSNTVSAIKHTYSLDTPKENFTLSISTVAILQGSDFIDTHTISKADLVQRSHREFLGHRFRSFIQVDEFSKSSTPEVSFSVTTAAGKNAVYDAVNHTMTVSDHKKGVLWTNMPVHYIRQYKGNMALHLFSITKGSRTYTVEFIAEITDRKLHTENLLSVNLVSERPGVVLSERFTDRVEMNKVNFNPKIIRSLQCSSFLYNFG